MVCGIAETWNGMRNALHVINSLSPENGGTSVSVPGLVLATAATGRYRNTILQADGCYQGNALGPDSTALSTSFSVLQIVSNLTVGGDIDALVRCADVVQIHGLWQRHSVTTGLLARRHRKPLVISAHGMLEPWALRNKYWKKWPYSLLVERPNLQSAAVLRALTVTEVDNYRRFGLSNPVAIIPNAVETRPKASPDLFLSSWPELRGRRIVLYLSRIHYKKGVDLLAKAWASIAAQFPDAHLVIAGPDFEQTQSTVEQLVKELSIGDRVTFTGPVYGDLKASLFAAASLFVLPSHSEGFSLAILESLAAGVPVIITKGCYFPEVATTDSGWVISPNVPELECSLREALELSTSDLSNRGERGFKLVRDKYTWSRVGQQMADVYDWVLGGDRPTTVEISD
jgi:glycosyltransferase involved in cell wall biosynthesis